MRWINWVVSRLGKFRGVRQGHKFFQRCLGYLSVNFQKPYSKVYYVPEGGNWVIDRIGDILSQALVEEADLDFQVIRGYHRIMQQVVHFGSRNAYLRSGFRNVHPSNRVVFTWFHGSEDDPSPENQEMIRRLPDCVSQVDRIVTSSSIARSRLLRWGVPESKIVVVPLGVDLSLFTPPTLAKRQRWRERLGIPDEAICIGSFQKDGVGWGEGLEPKLVKGPDVFLGVVARLWEEYPIFVLLTGPARGYVKRGLQALGVPYRHSFLRNYTDIVPYYHCLDLYLITSRDEGGPKALLESTATGVPVVSTRVGMAADMIKSKRNGYLVEVEDVEGILDAARELIQNSEMKQRCIRGALVTIQNYDWSEIARQYCEHVYKPLLA